MTQSRRGSVILVLPTFAAGVVCGALIYAYIPVWCVVVIFVCAVIFYALGAREWCTFFVGAVCISVRMYIVRAVPEFGVANPLGVWRQYLDIRLAGIHDSVERTLLSGILFGGSGGFSKSWKQVFIATGTMHVVAVSGTNLSFVVQLLQRPLERVWLPRRVRFFLYLSAIIVYVLLTGASASVVRAACMAVVMLLAPLVSRFSSGLHSLSLAAAFMILLQPGIAGDIGFQLSCLATLGLIIACESQEGFGSGVQASIAATLFVLPLECFYFGRFSVIGLLANALIAPCVPLLTFGGCGILLGMNFLAPLVHGLLWFMLHILAWCAAIPGSNATLTFPMWIVIAWYAVIGILIARWVRHKQAPG